MKLKSKIDNIESVKYFDNEIYYCTNSILYNKSNNDVINDVEAQSFQIKDGFLFFHSNDGEYCRYDLQHKVLKKTEFSPYVFSYKGNTVIARYDIQYDPIRNNFNHKNGLLDVDTGTLIKSYDAFRNYNFISLYSNCLIGFDQNSNIAAFDINISKELWQFDLSSIKNNPHDDSHNKEADWKIKKFIGMLDNKIWLALNHHTIIALDIETGKLTNRIHDVSGFTCPWLPSAIPHPEATVIDDKNRKLVGFMWEFYWEINPKSGEVSLYDLANYMKNKEIRNDISSFVLTEEHIYFVSQFESKIGALDRTTKKIVWQYEFQKNDNGLEPRIMNIQGNDSMLGALSTKGTLYLFEKVM